MAKIWVSEILHKSIATAIQLNGARGYSKDCRWNGCTAMRPRRSWSMVRPRFTRWSSPAICCPRHGFLALGLIAMPDGPVPGGEPDLAPIRVHLTDWLR